MRSLPWGLGAVIGVGIFGALGCATEPATSGEEDVVESNITAAAKITFTSDYRMEVSGRPQAGRPVRIEYALDRLPECRLDVGGGGPDWSLWGYYSENGGPAKSFAVTTLSPDGRDHVASPGEIVHAHGGDLAVWFQVSNRSGCSEFDSAFGQNFHVNVAGPPPDASATVVFKADGTMEQSGALRAGGKLKVRYEQERLPECRRVSAGQPLWRITGFAQSSGVEPTMFETGRPSSGGDREAIDAVIDLPRAGELSLWFQVTSLGGCMEYDSNEGANYKFQVE